MGEGAAWARGPEVGEQSVSRAGLKLSVRAGRGRGLWRLDGRGWIRRTLNVLVSFLPTALLRFVVFTV